MMERPAGCTGRASGRTISTLFYPKPTTFVEDPERFDRSGEKAEFLSFASIKLVTSQFYKLFFSFSFA